MKYVFLAVCSMFLAGCETSTKNGLLAEFDQPWENSNNALVIDAYWQNEIDWDKMASDQRVLGVIHKATEGKTFEDPAYHERRAEALVRGYLWGAYHLGKSGDPIQQAERFLSFINADDNELIALDIEGTSRHDMSLENARVFLQHVKKKTGRYPVLYVNHDTARKISGKFGQDEVFSKVPLWYARFQESVYDFPLGTWDGYTLWQFSSEFNCKPNKRCLYRVPGTNRNMDVNVFYGTGSDMTNLWPFGG